MYCAGYVLGTLVVVQRLYFSMRAAAGRQMSVRPLSTWVGRRCIATQAGRVTVLIGRHTMAHGMPRSC